MKEMKRLASLLLVLVMVFALSSTAWAANINVTGVKKGETYTAYKLLHYTTDGATAFSYYLTKDEYETSNTELVALLQSAGFQFTQSADNTLYYVNNTSELVAAGADSIVSILNTDNAKDTLNTQALSITSRTATADGTINITSLDTGYYFIDSSLGSLCELKSYDAQEVIFEKNTVPTVVKQVSDTNTTDDWNDAEAAQIGDTVYFQITITKGNGTDSAITLTDTLSDGLTYIADSLNINNQSVADNADDTNYKVEISGQVITIKFWNEYVKDNESIVVTYAATLNEKATVDSANTNAVKIQYSEQESTESKVAVNTYKFDIIKTDSSLKVLDGAEFELYDAETGGNKINLVYDDTNKIYRVATPTEVAAEGFASAVIKAGRATVVGLDNYTSYWLEETKQPDGYNILAARHKVEIKDSNLTTNMTGDTWIAENGGVQITNNTGTELPSTGSMGTRIFYIVGAVLVLGAVVLLIARRRMGSSER